MGYLFMFLYILSKVLQYITILHLQEIGNVDITMLSLPIRGEEAPLSPLALPVPGPLLSSGSVAQFSTFVRLLPEDRFLRLLLEESLLFTER